MGLNIQKGVTTMKTVTEKISGIRLVVNHNRVAVLKNGSPLMANTRKGTVRTFDGHAKARQFVGNLLMVSKSLTPRDFDFIPVAE